MIPLFKTKKALAVAVLIVGGAAYSAPAEAGWRDGYGGYRYDRVVVRHVYRPVVRRHVVVRHVYHRPVVRRVVIHHYPVYRPRPRPIYVSDHWGPPPWRYRRWQRPWHRPWHGGWHGGGRMCWIEPWLCR